MKKVMRIRNYLKIILSYVPFQKRRKVTFTNSALDGNMGRVREVAILLTVSTVLLVTCSANPGSRGTIAQIVTGGNHTCVRWNAGSVQCWGHNNNGQLGQGHSNTLGDEANEMGNNLQPIDLNAPR